MKTGRQMGLYVSRVMMALAVFAGLVAAVVTTPAATAAPSTLQSLEFWIGARVIVADPDGLNVRSGPGLDNEVIDYLPNQSAAYIAEGPEAADGYTWYRLEELGQDLGWVAGEFLSLVQRDGPGGPFDMVVVAEPALNVRSEPGLDGEVIDVLPYGTTVTINGGREVADGYTWMELDSGGWVASELLSADVSGDPGSPDGYEPGTRVAVNTDALNVRSEPGLGGAVVNVLPTGYVAFIADGPVSADGYDWYQVDAMGETLGWVAGEFLADAGDGGLMEPGTAIMVTTDWLNFRDGFGLDAPVIDVLPYGTEATFLSYPASGTDDGYDWYQIELTDGSVGWVAGEFIGEA